MKMLILPQCQSDPVEGRYYGRGSHFAKQKAPAESTAYKSHTGASTLPPDI